MPTWRALFSTESISNCEDSSHRALLGAGEKMNIIKQSAMALARAAKGNPIVTTVVVILFMLLFGVLESNVEKLIYMD